MDPATVRGGLVPAASYLGVRASDGTLVGMIQIRHALNDYLRRFGGHIGYSVRKGERRKGYAGEMLHLSLEKCREMGISRVLVTCDRENTASARTILSNGGMLEGEVREGAGVTQRYWIEV
ncbi:GNAT family N-acetyltransferase [Intestinimonas butyriciproducens]